MECQFRWRFPAQHRANKSMAGFRTALPPPSRSERRNGLKIPARRRPLFALQKSTSACKMDYGRPWPDHRLGMKGQLLEITVFTCFPA
jgi:hypothetical protein